MQEQSHGLLKGYSSFYLLTDLTAMKKRFPQLKTGIIGCSTLNRPIPYLCIGHGPFHWHFNGACHANEGITAWLLMQFAIEYLTAIEQQGAFWGKKANDLVEQTTLWIVPMLNPDGVDLVEEGIESAKSYKKDLLKWNRGSKLFHRWKANVRGVDLNDQFPAHWEEECKRRGIDGPAPRDFGGKKPLCEAETIALANFTVKKNFDAVLALHCQGEEIYWNYRDYKIQSAHNWAQRMARSNGYRAVYLTNTDAGYKDWFIEKFKKPGFTVEAGWGHNPLPLEGAGQLYDDIARLLAEALDCVKSRYLEDIR